MEEEYVKKNRIDYSMKENLIETGNYIRQHQIEHKNIYQANTDHRHATTIIEKDWEQVDDLGDLSLFEGIVISYFEGITPKSLISREELDELIPYLYSYLYQNEASLLFMDMSNIKIVNTEIQIIERTTKMYLTKKFLLSYWNHILEKSNKTHLQSIRSLFSFASETGFKCSFLILESNVQEIPLFRYSITSSSVIYSEWKI